MELENLLNSLEKREPTANMMLWMKYYDECCNRICCYSTDCGSIRCSGCLTYLTGLPPSTRFQCIECEILPPEAVNNPRPEVCEKCFSNHNILHHHSKWLKVDSKGGHEIATRTIGISELNVLKFQDFLTIDNPIGECSICCESFDKINVAVSYPGCKYFHGNPIYNKKKGVIDTKQFSHAQCLMNWYEVTKRNFYCGFPMYCDVCKFESEKQSWMQQFLFVKTHIKNENKSEEIILNLIEQNLSINISHEEMLNENNINKLIVDKLILLHPQEWLQIIIKEVFLSENNNVIIK